MTDQNPPFDPTTQQPQTGQEWAPHQQPQPATAPQPRSSWPAVLGIGVVMLLIGGAIGYFGGPLVLDDDESIEVAATGEAATTPTTATSTTAAPAESTTVPPVSSVDVWTGPDGTFQVELPAGWEVGADFYGVGQRALVASPDQSGDSYDAGFVSVVNDRRPGLTPESYLAQASESTKCTSAPTTQPYAEGGFTGLLTVETGCPNGYELSLVTVTAPDGSVIAVRQAVKDGDTAALDRALATFSTSVATTQVASVRCSDPAPSDDAGFPVSVLFVNHFETTISFGYLDPSTAEVADATTLEPGFTSNPYAREGDVYRFTLPSGPADHTLTADPIQCVVVTPAGLVSVDN